MLTYKFGIRCPHCGLLLREVDSLTEFEGATLCCHCEEEVEPTRDDVEIFYIINTTHPFMEGQQSKPTLELVKSAVPTNDSLTYLIQQGLFDVNKALYAPTDEQYITLQHKYEEIFELKRQTVAKGATLETLISELFSLCKHLNVSKVRLRPNEIDCYVRNKLFIPGLSADNEYDSFSIECKNEKTVPKAGYMNKLHSIMTTHGKRFGIIASKAKAPKTFISLSHDIFLKDSIVIISLDKDDLAQIIVHRKNLLECIARKIDETKLNATKSLVELGLYEA